MSELNEVMASEKKKSGGSSGILLGLLLGFAIGFLLKEEDKKRLVEFLKKKLSKGVLKENVPGTVKEEAAEEKPEIVEIIEEEKKELPKKRFFSRRK